MGAKREFTIEKNKRFKKILRTIVMKYVVYIICEYTGVDWAKNPLQSKLTPRKRPKTVLVDRAQLSSMAVESEIRQTV